MPRTPASHLAALQGLRLRQLREALDLSQQGLANIMGCADNTISGYESGRTRIDILALARFCEYAGISGDWVVLGRLGALPMDVAARIQTAQRAALSAIPEARKRGRPAGKPAAPTVDEAPSVPPTPRPTLLHERPARFLVPPKIT